MAVNRRAWCRYVLMVALVTAALFVHRLDAVGAADVATALDLPAVATYCYTRSYMPGRLPVPLVLAGLDVTYWSILFLPALLTNPDPWRRGWPFYSVLAHVVLSTAWLIFGLAGLLVGAG